VLSGRVEDVVARLRAAGCVFAEDEADLLIAAAHDPDELAELLDRRIAGRPLEQILGWAEFCGRRIVVEPGVFVPRRRTEYVVQLALDLAGPAPHVVDLCCGSGAIAAAFAAVRSDARVFAADVDPVAVHCARRNLDPLEVPVYVGDLFAALPPELSGRLDLLLVNAPYVPSDAIAFMPPEARDHEATVALDGGADGLDVHRRIAAGAGDWLKPGGHLLIETSEEQATRTAGALRAYGLTTTIRMSDALAATVVVARSGN
jgi:release factor glutamine methyltransferase